MTKAPAIAPVNQTRAPHLNRPLLGACLMILGMFVFPIGDAISKHLSDQYSVLGLSWFRFSIGAIVLLPFALRALLKDVNLDRKLIVEQSTRALLILGATIFFVAALTRIPMADTVGAYAIAPIVASILAVILLGEQWSPRKLIAVLLGFVGTLMIVRPGVGMDIGYIYALIAGSCFGGFLVANRWASSSVPSYFSIAFQTCFGLLALSPFIIDDLLAVRTEDIWLLILMGAGSTIAQILTIIAGRLATAGLLAPLVYFEIIGAVLLGYLIFGDVPPILTWTGILIVVCAGLILIRRRKA